MKKGIIIVIAIAIVILGGIVFLNSKSSGIQSAADEARVKAKQASLKAFVANMMVDLAKYYGDANNTLPYDQNPSVKQSIEAKLAIQKEKYPGNYSYKIYDSDDVAAIKLAETTSGIYVCADSVTIKVVDITSADFDKRTDCTGKTIK